MNEKATNIISGSKPTLAYILLMILLPILSVGQRGMGVEHVAPFLDSMNLEYYAPVENSVRFLKPKKNPFFKYDSRIKIKSNEMEVLVAFHSDTTSNPIATFFPHLEFNRLLNNVVPNDYDQDVMVIGWRETKLAKKNADWGAEAYIRPRQEITTFPYAKMLSFYKEDEGMVVLLYCFKDPDHVPELFAFREVEEDQ